jgi:AcrR family transcriptional regulator
MNKGTATRPRPRTQTERREESQRSLITAALEILAEDGVSSATFEAIGRRAGYSHALAGSHFGSKHGLYEAIILELRTQNEAVIADHRLDEMPGREAALTYMRLFFDEHILNQFNRAYVRLLASALEHSSALRVAFANEHQLNLKRMTEMIERGQREQDIAEDVDPEGIAMMMGGVIVGISVQMLLDPESNFTRSRDMALRALDRALLA